MREDPPVSKLIDACAAQLSHDDGQTMVEYALASSVFLIVAVGAIRFLGPQIAAAFQTGIDAFP